MLRSHLRVSSVGWTAWLSGVLLALPILALRYPPMPDLAMHEAMVALLGRLQDPSFVTPGIYFVIAPQANQLFHGLACLLSLAMPTDVACKVIVAGIAMLIALAMGRLLARAGRITALAPLVSFVTFGWCFRWGLVANLLGFGLLLLAIPLLTDASPSVRVGRSVARSMLAGAVLVLAHQASAVAFAVMALVFGLSPQREVERPKRSVRVLIALVPAMSVGLVSAGLALHASRAGGGVALAGASMQAIGSDFGPDPLERVLILPGAIFGGASSPVLLTESFVCLGLIAGAVVLTLRQTRRAREAADPASSPSVLPYAALAVIFFALYLVFPMAIGGTTLLAHRFLPPAFACFLVAASPAIPRSSPQPSSSASTLLALVALLAPVLVVALSWPSFRAADQRARDLDVLLPYVADDSAVAQLDLTPRPPGHVAPVPGLASRVQAVHGGRMLFAFTDVPPNPLYIRPALRWNEAIARLVSTPFAFAPALDGRRFAYLLVLETDARLAPLIPEALTPEYEPVRAQGQWQLFRSTLPLLALDSPEAPAQAGARLTAQATDTLARRLDAVVQAGH